VEEGGAVRLWDRVSGRERVRLGTDLAEQSDLPRALAFSPDGRTLATCQAGTLKLWDTATGLERLTLWESTRPVTAVAFAPDGKALAAATDLEMRLWYAAAPDEVSAQGK
jgi:WD40 repeat protein